MGAHTEVAARRIEDAATAHSAADTATGTTGPAREGTARRRIWVVGPGFLFLGGLSVYTCRLANALAADHHVAVLLLRRLIPARLYPGGKRTGQNLTSLSYADNVRVVGEIDWYWGCLLYTSPSPRDRS